MQSPFETAATAIKAIFDAEFAAEQYVMQFDNLHESLGRDRVEVGVAPVDESTLFGNQAVQETFIEVKFFDLWTDEIDPTTVIDPRRIARYAERFRNAIRRATEPHTEDAWYFEVQRVQYPNDPTGNKSRFVATLRCVGSNAALVETGT